MHLFTSSGSPNGKRVGIFMNEKGIDIPKTEIDLRAGENLSEDYIAKNFIGQGASARARRRHVPGRESGDLSLP